MYKISVIIPVYKNKEQFLKNLEHNLEYINKCEIIVVNDDPKESLADELKRFDNIILLENKHNLGFGQTVNIGVHESSCNYIFLLNTDVIINDTNFLKAIQLFSERSDLFGVSFSQIEKDGTIVGKNDIYWKDGMAHHRKANDIKFGPTGWVEGGSCIIDKKKFIDVGGFDPLFCPFYWEDNDLSYRARKMGYTTLFDPEIQVIHHHESTIGKYFSKSYINTIAFRNQLIFIWKNISDSTLTRDHIKTLIGLLLKSILKGNWTIINGFVKALIRLPEILDKRNLQKKDAQLSDKDLLSNYEI